MGESLKYRRWIRDHLMLEVEVKGMVEMREAKEEYVVVKRLGVVPLGVTT